MLAANLLQIRLRSRPPIPLQRLRTLQPMTDLHYLRECLTPDARVWLIIIWALAGMLIYLPNRKKQ